MNSLKRAFVHGAGLAVFGLGLAADVDAYTCAQTAPDALCGNPDEFQSCLIDVTAPTAIGGTVTAPRQYCIHVPTVFSSDARLNGVPVVFGFHGGGGDGGRMVSIWEKHTEQGMVLVFPSALPTTRFQPVQECTLQWRTLEGPRTEWDDFLELDDCRHPATNVKTPFGHDLAMVDAIASDIVDQGIEVQGFYATGFSSGAGMVFQLFITERSARNIDGFATVAIGLSDTKKAAVSKAGAPPYLPNPGIKKPILVAGGTSDKSYVPWQNFIDSINALSGTACPAAMTRVEEFVACYRLKETFPGLGVHTMLNMMETTLDWFVGHNDSLPRGIESLYPDLGHGSSFDREDATLAVRQDFRKRPNVADSAAVSGITIVYGRHNWPGNKGNAPPCSWGNCDVDLTKEILQFWRANAGLEAEWP